MATHTTTTQLSIRATIQGIPQLFADSFTTESVSESPIMYGSVGTAFATIFDASQTTIPPIGDATPTDQPFLFAIKASLQDIRVRRTDSGGNLWFDRVPAGMSLVIPDVRCGLTNALRLEQIDIQSVTGTADYAYILQHN